MAYLDRLIETISVYATLSDIGRRLPGILSWLIIALAFTAALGFRDLLSLVAAVFLAYLSARVVLIIVWNAVGNRRALEWGQRDWAVGDSISKVHHIVIIPNYKEPESILVRTLKRLAAQAHAAQMLTVVLAMEESEPGARAKGDALKQQFEGAFANLLVTVHPASLPGEIPGKASNQAWAARHARHFLVDKVGLPLDCLTVTSCDADSLLHPRYFEAITHQFVHDPECHRRFWQAPIFYDSNFWQVPLPTRFVTSILNSFYAAQLSDPLANPFPLSTYTVSLKLIEEADYWNTKVISEDWNMFLRCFFAAAGRIKVRPIYLPTVADAPDGETSWKAITNYYHQLVRHAWGAEDVGFILENWSLYPEIPWQYKLHRLTQVLFFHLLRSVAWFIIILGVIVSLTTSAFIIVLPALYLACVIGVGIIWLVELLRLLPLAAGSRSLILIKSFLIWVLMPLVMLILTAIPALHAQSRLSIGQGLAYRVTLKRPISTP